jgi:hypothetical protein
MDKIINIIENMDAPEYRIYYFLFLAFSAGYFLRSIV